MYNPEQNCFRKDLIITSLRPKGESARVFLIKEPNSGETFEFGEEEYFLCKLMDGKLNPTQIIAAFQEKYQLQLSQNDFEDFASSILDYGLLESYQEPELELGSGQPDLTGENRSSDLIISQSNIDIDRVSNLPDSGLSTRSKLKQKAKTEADRLVIFRPGLFFKHCANFLKPLSVLVWLILPAVVLAFFTVVHNRFYLWDSLLRLWKGLNPILAVSMSLITVNLISELFQGIVYSYYGGRVESLAIKIKMGILPLFSVDLQGIKRLSRQRQLWVFATPLLTRIVIGSLGILIWKMTYTNPNSLAVIVLFPVQSSLIGLLVDSSPFWDSNGYRWFSLYFNLPRLFERSLRVWYMMLNRRPFPKTLSSKERLSLQIYACFLVLTWVTLLLGLVSITAILLEQSFQGAGVVIFLILIVLVLRWYFTMNSKPNHSQTQVSKITNNSQVSPDTNNGNSSLGRNKWLKFIDKNRWSILGLIVLAFVLSLPYKYRPGGSIKLLPPKQRDIQADISGKVTKVFFPGGDNTWVKKGEVIATMEASRQLNPATPIDSDVLVLQEQIKNQKALIETKQAQLDELLSTPRKEDIKVAKTQLQTAQQQLISSQKTLEIAHRELELAKNSLRVAEAEVDVAIKSYETVKIKADFLTNEAERYQQLYENGVVSLQSYEDRQKLAEAERSEVEKEQQSIRVKNNLVAEEEQKVQVARQKVEEQKQNVQTSQSKVDEKESNLELVLSGPHPEKITAASQEVEAAKATLQATQQQLISLQSQLQGKNLLMPFDGHINTAFLDQKVNTYLQQGTTFAVAEDNRNIQGQINVPETDVGLFNIGQEVEVKLAAYPNLSLIGKIISIEPATQETDQGRFVQVVVELPNSEKLLKSGMSGYAKMEGTTMPVIAAFTRPIVRFIQIEIWSWIP